MGSQTSRRDKVEWLQRTIQTFFSKRPKGVINKDNLLSEFALKFFSTKRTGKEILHLIENTGRIKIKRDIIIKGDKND